MTPSSWQAAAFSQQVVVHAGCNIESQEQNNKYVRDIGAYLDSFEVNCIVIVLGDNPRWDRTLQQFFQILLNKIHPDDYKSIAFVARYGHCEVKRKERKEGTGKEEAES